MRHPRQEPQLAPVDARPARGLSGRLTALADRPLGTVVLVVLALMEATIFPGPTEAMLVALTLGRRERAARFAAIAVAASVVGGIAGYFLGAAVFADLVHPLLSSYGMTGHIDTVARVYADNALLALGTSGYTPVPYMLYTALAGAGHLSLPVFVLGSLIGRTLKYVPIAAVAYLLGPRAHTVLRRYGAIVTGVLLLALIVYLLR